MTTLAHTRRKRDNEYKPGEVVPIRKDDEPNISILPVLLVFGCLAFIAGWVAAALVAG